MNGLQDIIINSFYVVLLVLCIFIVVHATIQFKNSQFTANYDSNKQTKKPKTKMIKVIAIALVLFIAIYFKVISGVSNYKASQEEIENFAITKAELKEALMLEFNVYGKDTYSTAEDMALSLNYRLPIKKIYNTRTKNEEPIPFSKYEILTYRLNDFVNKPTLVSYDGTMLSIIKFKEGCKYVNNSFIGKSDCIIEVDLNHYQEPNQIGQDRILFAIDGKNNTIKTTTTF